MDCLFCKIASGEINSEKVFENDKVLVFKDINPAAPLHLLIIPKEHIESAAAIDSGNSHIVAGIFEVAAKLARDHHLDNGYRIVTNIGDEGGQTVKHLHFHLLGSRKFAWPPG